MKIRVLVEFVVVVIALGLLSVLLQLLFHYPGWVSFLVGLLLGFVGTTLWVNARNVVERWRLED